MYKNNTNSKRGNIFRKIYQSEDFKDALKHRAAPAPFPFMIDIEVTNHCNLSCNCCAQQIMTRKKGFMEWELFRKIIDECALHNTPIRLIRFGEPFLHKDILKYCSYAKERGLPVHITNNGLIITEEHMKALVDIGIDSIIFSFQGASKERYEIMRNNHCYDRLASNIVRMVELRGTRPRPYIHVSSTMTDESHEEVDDFVNCWSAIVDSVGTGKTNLTFLSENQLKSLKSVSKIKALRESETIKKIYSPCTEVYQKLSVDWDGKVTCCCGDYDNFMVVGDILVSSLYDIWNSSRALKKFRSMLDANMHGSLPLCKKCYHTYEDF